MATNRACRGQIGGVVLAAGAASRFGRPKQNILLPAVLERLARAELAELVVVAGAHPITAALPDSIHLVECPEWAEGPGASLRCGLRALSASVEAAVVLLADGPALDPRAIERLVSAWRSGGGDVLAASYDGVRSHPVLMARAAWCAVPLGGGRELAAVLVDCSDLPRPGDVDTEADLAAFEEDLEH